MSTAYWQLVRHASYAGGLRGGGCFRGVLFHQFVAGGAQLQKRSGLFVETLAFVAVKRGFLKDAEDRFGTEIIFVVKAMHGGKDIVGGQAGILDVCELMSAFID